MGRLMSAIIAKMTPTASLDVSDHPSPRLLLYLKWNSKDLQFTKPLRTVLSIFMCGFEASGWPKGRWGLNPRPIPLEDSKIFI